jgi:hypothetical protein
MWVNVLSVVLALVLTAQPVLAGWLSWASAGCTLVGVGAAVFGGPGTGQVVGGALGIVQLVGLATDIVITVFDRPRGNRARAAAGNAHAAFLPQGIAFLDAEFQHLPLQGDNTDPLVNAANDMIDVCNAMLADARNGADVAQIDFDLFMLSLAVDRVADEFQALGFEDLQFTQADLDGIRQAIGENGLPQFEVQMLQDAGMSENFISALQDYMAQTDLSISTASISISEFLRETA